MEVSMPKMGYSHFKFGIHADRFGDRTGLKSYSVKALCLCALIVLPLISTSALAQTDEEAPVASVNLGASLISPGVSDPLLGKVVVGIGNSVKILRAVPFVEEKSIPITGNVTDAPALARLDYLVTWAVFVGTNLGWAYRIDPVSGAIVWSRFLGRVGCSDSVSVTPIVHLRRSASRRFQAHYATDIVYFFTRNTSGLCPSGSNTLNKVYGLRVSDGATLWWFLGTALQPMDRVQGGYLDADNDLLYVSTERTASIDQASLWVIDTVTGILKWSANAGRAVAPPLILGERVYVAANLAVKAYDRWTHALVWSLDIGTPLKPSLFAEDHPGYGPILGVVGIDGRVRLIQEIGATTVIRWIGSLPNGAQAMSGLAAVPTLDWVYAGGDDGRIYQLDLFNGNPVAYRDPSPGEEKAVTDAFWIWERVDADRLSDIPRLVCSTSTGSLAQFIVPWVQNVWPVRAARTNGGGLKPRFRW